MVCADTCVVKNVVYMACYRHDNYSNKTWHVLMCSVQQTKEKKFKGGTIYKKIKKIGTKL